MSICGAPMSCWWCPTGVCVCSWGGVLLLGVGGGGACVSRDAFELQYYKHGWPESEIVVLPV